MKENRLIFQAQPLVKIESPIKVADAGTPKQVATTPITPVKPLPEVGTKTGAGTISQTTNLNAVGQQQKVATTATQPKSYEGTSAVVKNAMTNPTMVGSNVIDVTNPETGEKQTFTRSNGQFLGLAGLTIQDFLKNQNVAAIKDTDTSSTAIKETSSDLNIGDAGQIGATPSSLSAPSYDIAKGEEKATEAMGEYEKSMGELGGIYKASQDSLVEAANNKYNAELTNLKNLEQLQAQLTAQSNALIEGSAGIQKQELKNAYDANQRAMELQQKKVAESYKAMQQEQYLLNKQREIKSETAMGMIYGFGSVAGNKNLEDTVMQGEGALMKLKNDAVNADTEIQNKVVELNQAFELDTRKIEQWKSEQIQENYQELQKYLMEIQNDKSMAEVDKIEAINKAVNGYNEQVGQLHATTAQAKYDLSMSLIERADSLTQQQKDNDLRMAQENREQTEFELKTQAVQKEQSIGDLDLMMKTYSTSDWAGLPKDVQNQMNELATQLNMPASFAQQAFETYKQAAEAKEAPDFKFYTDNDGKVSAVTYNPDTGQFETVSLGDIAKGETSKWTTTKDKDGNPILVNTTTGETRKPSEFTGGASGTPADALNVPDGAKGGQCGHFVNQYSGIGLGDSYESKMSKMDPSITAENVQPGDIFIMPYDWTGHGGFIVSVEGNPPVATVKDSNWGKDEKVQTHTIPLSKMTGFARPGGTTETPENITSVDTAYELGVESTTKPVTKSTTKTTTPKKEEWESETL